MEMTDQVETLISTLTEETPPPSEEGSACDDESTDPDPEMEFFNNVDIPVDHSVEIPVEPTKVENECYLAFPYMDPIETSEQRIRHAYTIQFDGRVLQPNYTLCKEEVHHGEPLLVTFSQFSDNWNGGWKLYGTVKRWIGNQRWMSLYIRNYKKRGHTKLRYRLTFTVTDDKNEILYTKRSQSDLKVCFDDTTGFTNFLRFEDLLKYICNGKLYLQMELVLHSFVPRLGWHSFEPWMMIQKQVRHVPCIPEFFEGTDDEDDTDTELLEKFPICKIDKSLLNPALLAQISATGTFGNLKDFMMHNPQNFFPNLGSFNNFVFGQEIPNPQNQQQEDDNTSNYLSEDDESYQLGFIVNNRIVRTDLSVSQADLEKYCKPDLFELPGDHLWAEEGVMTVICQLPTDNPTLIFQLLQMFQTFIKTGVPKFLNMQSFYFARRLSDIARVTFCMPLVNAALLQMSKTMTPIHAGPMINFIKFHAANITDQRILLTAQSKIRKFWERIRTHVDLARMNPKTLKMLVEICHTPSCYIDVFRGQIALNGDDESDDLDEEESATDNEEEVDEEEESEIDLNRLREVLPVNFKTL